MKAANVIWLTSTLICTLALCTLTANAQSPYDDTYFNQSTLKRDAQAAKERREKEAKAQQEYEKQQYQTEKQESDQVKRPEDFNSYAEYREYLDNLGKNAKTTSSQNNRATTSAQNEPTL